jgi:lysozyme
VNITKLQKSLELHEGKVRHAYQDSKGYWTIGIGCMVDKRLGGGLCDKAIYAQLEHNINECLAFTKPFQWFDDLNAVRQNVIIELLFNLGPVRFRGFKDMIAALNDGDFGKAADELLDSKWARQDVGPIRSMRLAKMLRTGQFPPELLK